MDLYSDVVRSDLQAENARLCAQALRLAEEKRQLEQLVKDYQSYVLQGMWHNSAQRDYAVYLDKRAKALLAQEDKSCHY